jgi:hypothetical protein
LNDYDDDSLLIVIVERQAASTNHKEKNKTIKIGEEKNKNPQKIHFPPSGEK